MITKILSVKIKKDHVLVEFQESFEVGLADVISFDTQKRCNCNPHPDLLAAFDRLAIHLVNLCEQYAPMSVGDGGEAEYDTTAYRVTGYSIGGEDETEGITLIGQKRLSNNRVLNLIAPFTKWQDEHNEYGFIEELKGCIEHAEEEVKELLNGKKAKSAQGELEFPEN